MCKHVRYDILPCNRSFRGLAYSRTLDVRNKPEGEFDSGTHTDCESMSTVLLICVYKKTLPLAKQGFVRSSELGISKMPI